MKKGKGFGLAARLVLDATKRLYERGLNSAMSGNVSIRVPGIPNLMLITPSGLDKYAIAPGQLSVMDIGSGELVSGPKQSSEYQVHTHIYLSSPEINAVVHPHPIYSLVIVRAFGRKVLDSLPEIVETFDYYTGGVGIVKGKSGTKELARLVAGQISSGKRTVIMEDHGTVGTGENMQKAIGGVEFLEDAAHMYSEIKMHEALRRWQNPPR